MLRSLKRTIKQDKEQFKIPKGVQDIIPVKRIYSDGIFQVGNDKYSKMFQFSDINYATASLEDKQAVFLEYSELLNSLDAEATTKLTINNRRVNRKRVAGSILIDEKDDELNEYRREYNSILMDKATGGDAIIQDKYITVSVHKKDIEEARTYFIRTSAELQARFNRLGVKCQEISTEDRLRIIFEFLRAGEEELCHVNIKEMMRNGHDFRDYVAPDSYEHHSDYFRVGNRYGRALFMRTYGNWMNDDVVDKLTSLNRNMMLSIDIVPVPTEEAIREAEAKLFGVATNITNWQRKQNQNNNFSAEVPYDMELQRKEAKEFLDDLVVRDQRMMQVVLTMVLTADTKEQLDSDTKTILTDASNPGSQMSILRFQQLEGMQTAMPYGVRKIDSFRTLITESLAVFMPFRVQEVQDQGGIYYGQNAISKNMIIADRRKLLNGNSFILGVSGSGKSFAGKNEITNLMLSSDADIIIIDPEREYAPLVRAMNGEVVEISAASPNHINAMDMSKDYGEVDPIIEKSQFLQSLCEQIISGHSFKPGQQSIIDRCTENVYREYKMNGYRGDPPTLVDFRDELLRQPEEEARSLALELELFVRGSLNTFAKQTNVNTNNRLICYDILELGEQLRAIGMLIILDSILNRITANRMKGRETFIIIDEIYLLFMHEYSAQFLFKLWKRVRKYGAYCTGITQNVEDLLQSHTARTMLSNSEFIIMLNQAATDRGELARLLNISEDQEERITNVGAGQGLIKIGSSMIPFVNDFPRDTKLYKLMTTKLSEVN